MPASVAAARRSGTADGAALHSGAAWASLLDSLRQAGEFLHDPRLPEGPEADASGYRHLLVLLALGILEALDDESDPYQPVLTPGHVDNTLKWGMDCPDALYTGCSIRGDAEYRVTGTRGTARYLGFQAMGGMETVANAVADDLAVDDGGHFELLLSARRQPGNWMRLDERVSSLVVRQFFYDWEAEEPAELRIECMGRPDCPPAPSSGAEAPGDAAAVARQVEALGKFVLESVRFWWDIEEMGRAQGLNAFRQPNARTDMGGAEENVTEWGSWDLVGDQALLIEVTPPEAVYWSLAMGNQWWESLDYAGHQTSLNGHQAVLDDDGVFRAVVAPRDPGVANWLDTLGERRGPMIFRWLRAADHPLAATRVVPLADLHRWLPEGTRRVTQEERAATIAGRRSGVRKRFGR